MCYVSSDLPTKMRVWIYFLWLIQRSQAAEEALRGKFAVKLEIEYIHQS